MFRISDLIIKKRDGNKLSKEEIEYFVDCVVRRHVQDVQLGAMLMAIFLKNLDHEETVNLTRAMINSGKLPTWPSEMSGQVVDKHSTGGVGDKISLILAPALAVCGMKVPMISGRGLAFTGGTLDKLESIPGFTVDIGQEQMTNIIQDVGCCIVGQTESLVPADKFLYAARDVTGTIDNTALITASIISKKVAERVDVLVLDVKCGNGTFCKTEDKAREVATSMVKTGNGLGVKTVALITKMDAPIGYKIGNALEVAESLACLQGNGPDDIMDLVTQLGAQVLHHSKLRLTIEQSVEEMRKSISSGDALTKFKEMMIAQGVSRENAENLCTPEADIWSILPKAKHITPLISMHEGIVADIDSLKCADISLRLGAGRNQSTDVINHAVGLELCVHIGSEVAKGQTWMNIHHDEPIPNQLLDNIESILSIVPFGENVVNQPRIIATIT